MRPSSFKEGLLTLRNCPLLAGLRRPRSRRQVMQLNLCLLGHLQSVVYLDAKVPDSAFQLRMAQ